VCSSDRIIGNKKRLNRKPTSTPPNEKPRHEDDQGSFPAIFQHF
jgi:hypothetical protein